LKTTCLLAMGALGMATLIGAAQAAPDIDGMELRPDADAADTADEPGDPPRLGRHFTRKAHAEREERRAKLLRSSKTVSPLMTNHGGKIMNTVVSKAIFWGPKWANPSFAGDKIAGLDNWYTYHSGSNYAMASGEFTGSNGAIASSGLLHLGHVVDTTTASGGSRTTTILAEVCRMIPHPDPQGNGYYPVYTDIPRGRAQYCAWHSYGSCGGIPVQFAFFFNLDGDPGCDPQDNPATTGHSQGLAALANVTAHEISEARTDPASPGAWYDSQGQENGDKCAWTFGASYVTLTDGGKWKLQGEWSNAAYKNGTGYPNLSGQKGCLGGM
jgi:hypothetical protein